MIVRAGAVIVLLSSALHATAGIRETGPVETLDLLNASPGKTWFMPDANAAAPEYNIDRRHWVFRAKLTRPAEQYFFWESRHDYGDLTAYQDGHVELGIHVDPMAPLRANGFVFYLGHSPSHRTCFRIRKEALKAGWQTVSFHFRDGLAHRVRIDGRDVQRGYFNVWTMGQFPDGRIIDWKKATYFQFLISVKPPISAAVKAGIRANVSHMRFHAGQRAQTAGAPFGQWWRKRTPFVAKGVHSPPPTTDAFWRQYPLLLLEGESLVHRFGLELPEAKILRMKLLDAADVGANLFLEVNGKTMLPRLLFGADGDSLSSTPGLVAEWRIPKSVWGEQGQTLTIRNRGSGFAVVKSVELLSAADETARIGRTSVAPQLGFNATLSQIAEPFSAQSEEAWLATGCMPGGIARNDFHWKRVEPVRGQWAQTDETARYYKAFVAATKEARERGLDLIVITSAWPKWIDPEQGEPGAGGRWPDTKSFSRMLATLAGDIGPYVDMYTLVNEPHLLPNTFSRWEELIRVATDTLKEHDTVDADGDGRAFLFSPTGGREAETTYDMLYHRPIGRYTDFFEDHNYMDPKRYFYHTENAFLRHVMQKAMANPKYGYSGDEFYCLTEAGHLGQGNGQNTFKGSRRYTWADQLGYYRDFFKITFRRLFNRNARITFFRLSGDDWGIVGCGGYVNEATRREHNLPGPYPDSRYVCLTPAWNTAGRPAAITHTLSGFSVPAYLKDANVERLKDVVVKSVAFRGRHVVVAAANRGRQRVEFTVIVPGRCASVDFYEARMALLQRAAKPLPGPEGVKLRFSLDPGQCSQYILRAYAEYGDPTERAR